MESLLLELLPQAPHLGLYVAPSVPEDKVRNAIGDYARSVAEEDVLALYDATLLGNAKDGAVFLRDRVVFQNNDLEPTHEVRYADVVRVVAKRKLLGGRKVQLDVNRGRATVTLTMDFSGRPDAAEFVARFLHETMLRGTPDEQPAPRTAPDAAATDAVAVRSALERLHEEGRLTRGDLERMMAALSE